MDTECWWDPSKKKTPFNRNVGRPLLQRWIKYLRIYLYCLEEGDALCFCWKEYFFRRVPSTFGIHCRHFSWFEIIYIIKVQFRSLPLVLFHIIWNHNSKGTVSPPFRPKVLWEFHNFCKYDHNIPFFSFL